MIRFRLFLLLPLFAMLRLAAHGQSKAYPEVTQPVKTVIQQIRAGKDDQVFKNVDMYQVSKYLLGADYEKATDQQRTEFNSLFQALFAKIAFPKVRDNFRKLAAINYENPQVAGNEAKLASLVILDNPLKKQEMKLKYSLVKSAQNWKVADVAVLGSSMMESIRNDQVTPLLKEGGMEHLLQVMRGKNKELR